MGDVMTKEEFTRKLLGHKQTQKNEYLKTVRANTDADTFLYNNSLHIRKQKHISW